MRHTVSVSRSVGLAIFSCAALVACGLQPGDEESANAPVAAETPATTLAVGPTTPGPRVPAEPTTLDPWIPPVIDPDPVVTLTGPGTLYISNRTYGGVMMWDVASETFVGGYPTVGESRVAASPDRKSVYVATSQLGTVDKIDTATHTKVATTTIAAKSSGIIVSPDSSRIFVTQSGGLLHSTSASLTGPVVTESISGSGLPGGMAWSANGQKLFIADGFTSNVFVRHGGGGITKLPLPAGASNGLFQLASMPSKGLVFAPNFAADTVTAFDDDGTVFGTAGSTVGAGDLPMFAAAHRSRPYVYITSPRADRLVIAKVDMVNGAPQLSIQKVIGNVCDAPNGVTFSRSQARAFVVCNDAVVVVDSSTDTVLRKVPGPAGQFEVAWAL